MTARKVFRYSDKLANKILERLANGESLRAVCRDDDMPHLSSVLRWIRDRDDLREQYTRAREASADSLYEELLGIVDDMSAGTTPVYDKKGEQIGVKVDPGYVQQAKARLDARKWMMARMQPKKYGDKQVIEQTVKQGFDRNDIEAVKEQLRDLGIDPEKL